MRQGIMTVTMDMGSANVDLYTNISVTLYFQALMLNSMLTITHTFFFSTEKKKSSDVYIYNF